ncbi:uncharacterized protein BJ171DRAFT_582503 [Polychytrium aggregatum]|uniref:uncharacterized protein n=1 Tax=Polychytrium aggregatum TaxID=110093 RepID=UPI0022FE2EA2|nr:uncharacterized protein BJ171DRAFT_582503 [Polychytrium aggregatum]KAI9204127.1 hypothetical protein BJ171DRAFT_582503 [Polychytrium aggregatum]
MINPSIPPQEMGLHPSLDFVEAVQQIPDFPAIRTTENDTPEIMSFKQLWDLCWAVAKYLKDQPGWHQSGDNVGIYVDTDSNWPVAAYSLWLLGKVPVTFGPGWTRSVRETVCERLGINFVLHGAVHPGDITGVALVDLPSVRAAISVVPVPADRSLCPEHIPEVTAVCHTSGSTGVPKSVNISTTRAPRRMSLLNGNELKSCAIVASPSFGTSTAMVVAMTRNLSTIWLSKPTADSSTRTARVAEMLRNGAALTLSSPSYLRLLLSYAQAHGEVWSSVETYYIAGELITPALITAAKNVMPNAEFRCLYSSTECATLGAFNTMIIPSSAPAPESIVYHVDNPLCKLALLDEDGNELPADAKKGILCFAVSPDHRCRNTAEFKAVTADTSKLASFNFLQDGRPRVCTSDVAEIIDDRHFTVIGRTGRTLKINLYFADLDVLEEKILLGMNAFFKDSFVTSTSSTHIVLLYALKPEYVGQMTGKQVLDETFKVLAANEFSNVTIHNVIELPEMPYNDAGKKDRKTLNKVAAQAESEGRFVEYPLLDMESEPVAWKVSIVAAELLDAPRLSGRDFYFASCGFNLVQVDQLSEHIQSEFGVHFQPGLLLSNGMSPRQIAEAVAAEKPAVANGDGPASAANVTNSTLTAATNGPSADIEVSAASAPVSKATHVAFAPRTAPAGRGADGIKCTIQ